MVTGDSSYTAVGSAPGGRSAVVVSDRDIVFNCPACQGELVVDRDGAGMAVPCSHCGHQLTIPDYQPAPLPEAPGPDPETPRDPAPSMRRFSFEGKAREELERRFSELKNQLKENRSQDTEMRGHVNRATMELHRLQLKLKKLQERHIDIGAELHALADWLDSAAP